MINNHIDANPLFEGMSSKAIPNIPAKMHPMQIPIKHDNIFLPFYFKFLFQV